MILYRFLLSLIKCSSGQKKKIVFLALMIIIPAFFSAMSWARNGALFQGDIVSKWSKDGRTMTILEAINFIDSRGIQWPVPSGVEVNGSSIPRIFWSIIGAPLTGKHRAASVVHDYYCDVRTRPWRKVHKMFHEALLATGEGQRKAWLMYTTVQHFGPRWEKVSSNKECEEKSIEQLSTCATNSTGQMQRVFLPNINAKSLAEFESDLTSHGDYSSETKEIRMKLEPQ